MRIDSVSSLELQPPAAPVLAPYASFLGLREGEVDGERRYFLDFREEYVGNPLIRTFPVSYTHLTLPTNREV